MEPLALFEICIRIFFFFLIQQQAEACAVSFELLSKQIEVFYAVFMRLSEHSLKKDISTFPSTVSLFLTISLSPVLFNALFFFFLLASGVGKGSLELKVKWKVDRFL